MIGQLAGRAAWRLGRPGAHLAAEAADLALLGPRLFVRQRRDGAAGALNGRIRADWYRRLWQQAADEIGATVVAGPGPLLTLTRAGRSTRVWGHFLALDDPVTLKLAGDKPAAHEVLTAHGLRVPAHEVHPLATAHGAMSFVERHGSVVVKPAAATGAGSGVTGGVRTSSDLRRALLRSAPHDTARVLIEEHASGRELRVLVVRGDAIAVVERRPPQVHGDGVSTVAELVDRENRRRVGAGGDAGLMPLGLDLDAALVLARDDMTFTSVPGRGRPVKVKSSTSQGGDRDATAIDVGDPSVAGVVADATLAASALGTAYASVEFITADPSSSTSSAGVVLEVNTTPGIAQHHAVDNRGSTPHAAAAVLDRVLSD